MLPLFSMASRCFSLARFGHAILNGPCQLFLPLQLHHRIVAGLTNRSVTCDFAGFNGAAAFLLPHGDVSAPERMEAEAGEVTAGFHRRDLERLPHPRVPHRLAAV